MGSINHDDSKLYAESSISPFLNAKEKEVFTGLGVRTAEELLQYFPKRYEDRTSFQAFPSQAGGDPVCIRGVVWSRSFKGGRGRSGYFEAVILAKKEDVFEGGKITCRWFNMPYLSKILAAGQDIILFGKVKSIGGALLIDHPEFELIPEEKNTSLHMERIVPVYPLKSGLTQRRIRELCSQVIEFIEPTSLAPIYQIDHTFPRVEAYREMHFPSSMEAKEAAYRYFAAEEFFSIQLNVAYQRYHYRKNKGYKMGMKKSLLTEFYKHLDYDLTGAQKRCVKEIARDMVSEAPMNRLVQGDVGSGKTLVALCSGLLAVESGYQVALMAPTQILAEQHYLGFCKAVLPLGIKVGICTGNKKENLDGANIIIGTHALLYDDIFEKLGLVIVDEQHKFGVKQRASLIQKGFAPDVLVMTATPIPRTMTLMIYGDLDISVIDEKPLNRASIITGVRVKPKVPDVTNFLKKQMNDGRQVYIVYPLVEESENLAISSAKTEFEKWKKRLSKYDVGLLHGKMKPEEKERKMAAFRDAKLDVLVATSVIEVGVDVPNATVMVIYHAERFGLSQLHQLRGRVGRGEYKSYCVLVTDGKNDAATSKLNILADIDDGFKLAEEDLRLRGPGDALGSQQSGIGGLKFPEAVHDHQLVKMVRELARNVIESDPKLEKNEKLNSLIRQDITFE